MSHLMWRQLNAIRPRLHTLSLPITSSYPPKRSDCGIALAQLRTQNRPGEHKALKLSVLRFVTVCFWLLLARPSVGKLQLPARPAAQLSESSRQQPQPPGCLVESSAACSNDQYP
jgi:hypothetical protein